MFVPGQFGTFPEEHTQSGIRPYLGSGLPDVAVYDDLFLQRGPMQPWLLDIRARHLRKGMFTTLKQLQEREAAEWRIDEQFGHYQNALTDIIEKVSRRAVEYARRFEKP